MRDVLLGSSEDTFRHLSLLILVEYTGISKLCKFLYLGEMEGVYVFEIVFMAFYKKSEGVYNRIWLFIFTSDFILWMKHDLTALNKKEELVL